MRYQDVPNGCLEGMYHQALQNVLEDKLVRRHKISSLSLRVVPNPDKSAMNSEIVIATAELKVRVEYSNEYNIHEAKVAKAL